MSVNYRNCYSVMRLSSGASWEELRRSYKHLVQHCHPDRFEQHLGERKEAELSLRDLNSAYQALEQYYKAHGKLPVVDVRSHSNLQYSNTFDSGEEDPDYTVTEKRVTPSLVTSNWFSLGVATALGLVIAVVLVGSLTDDEREVNEEVYQQVPASMQMQSPSFRKSRATFKYGDTSERVLEVQGEPTYVVGDSWFYGASRVDFQQGRVVDWHSQQDAPLYFNGTLPGKKRKLIQLGFGEEDVIAIQGEPLMRSKRRWGYGPSFVDFRRGKVINWYSSVLWPLAVDKKSNVQN